MDLELTKPLYIFILDLRDSDDITPLPKSLLRRCSQELSGGAGIAPHNKAMPAIRGSSCPFGSWSKDGKRAVEIAEGMCYTNE